jgi:hypothetical protein
MGTTNPPTTNIKPRIPTVVQPTSSTARVSDLDALMAEKQVHINKIPPTIELKSTIISPSPMANNIRRSLFSTDSVKVVRPVRSQELKIFSSHLTSETSKPPVPPRIMNETFSILIPTSSEQKTDNNKSPDNYITEKNDDSYSNTSAVLRELSEDSLNSLNEHYHIRQLLKSSKSSLYVSLKFIFYKRKTIKMNSLS